MDFTVKVYSTLKHVQQPDEITINKNATFSALVYIFLTKNNLHLIDFNLIKVYRVDSETSKKLYYLINVQKSHTILDDHMPEYYLSVEEGICIKRNYDRYISISSITTAVQLFNMLIKEFSVENTKVRYNLFHNSGKLKPDDLPVLAIKITGSNEFQIVFNQILPYKEIIEKEILKQLPVDYEISSPKNNYHVSKSVNNLLKVPYNNSDRKYQRKLPQLSNVNFKDLKNKHFDETNEEKNLLYDDKEKKRFLPNTPNMFQFINDAWQEQSTHLDLVNMVEKEFITPPEPVFKTNAIFDEILSSSSPRSVSSPESVNADETERKLSNSVIPRQYSTELEIYSPNLYQIVKYCNLISIDLSIRSNATNPFPIKLKENLFQTYKIIENNKSESFTFQNYDYLVETEQEKLNSSVVVIENIHENDVNFYNNNIENGDILVDIDNENMLNKQKEFIYSKLSKDVKHQIIIARYKYLCKESNSKKKDQKITKLKTELENLKQKYLALHSITTGNNQIIQQLNKELRNKQSTTS